MLDELPVDARQGKESGGVDERGDVGCKTPRFVERGCNPDLDPWQVMILAGFAVIVCKLQNIQSPDASVFPMQPGMRQVFLYDMDVFPLKKLEIHLIITDDIIFLLPAPDLRDRKRAIHPRAEIDVPVIKSLQPRFA